MIVMKFGGTSVEDAAAIRRLVSIVRRHLYRQPVVVVSAMSKITNTLLECAKFAARGDRETLDAKLGEIKDRHFAAADELAAPEERARIKAAVEARLSELRATLDEINRAGEVTPRLSDAVSANGELLSSVVVAAAFRGEGMKGVWVDVRPAMRTNDDFMRAAIDFDAANPRLAETFRAALADGGVPVTQGFIGSTSSGVTTTIGRGGSDYSAAIIGAACDAEEIQIWTDVDGIMTTDPRIVPEAAKVKVISFAEASELAYFGAKVLHPSTLRPAMAKDIPVTVCNSRRPEVQGTVILRHAPHSPAPIKAIAFKRGITVVDVTSDRMLMAHGFLAKLFEVFNRHETAVDMVATSEVSVSVTLDDTRHLDRIVADLEELGDVIIERDRALICLVGEQMKFTPGLAWRIFKPLETINISMISHGASAINASFVIDGRHVEEAVTRLHREFFSELDEETFEPVGPQAAGKVV
jgi:aspartate kinase